MEAAMATAFADVDFASLTRRLAGRFRGRSFDDAEESVAEATVEVAVLMEREEVRSPAAVIAKRAYWQMLRKVERGSREVSLDDLLDEDEDREPFEVGTEDALDARLELHEARRHPVMAMKVDATEAGGSPVLSPRGTYHTKCRYSDEQVIEVRELRAQGLVYTKIAAQTGVPLKTVEAWCRRHCRSTPSMPGWSRELAIEVLRRFARERGRLPTYSELRAKNGLPPAKPLKRLFGTTSPARIIHEAGGVWGS